MTHYAIAKKLGVTPQAVSLWFNGKTMPSTKNLAALSRLLGKDMETLIKEFERKKARK